MAYNEVLQRLKRFTDVVEFERLASDVLSRNGHRGLEPQGVGAIDRAKDAMLVVGKNKKVYHYSVRKDYKTKLGEDLESTKRRKHLKKGQHFVFVTTRHVPAPTADELKKLVRKRYGWVLDVWGSERLRVELENDSDDLAEKYLGVRSHHPGALEHLRDLQEQVITPLRNDARMLDACVHLGHPLISATFKGREIPSALMTGSSQFLQEEFLQVCGLTKQNTVLSVDACRHHFDEASREATAFEKEVQRAATRAAEIAQDLGKRVLAVLPLPTSASVHSGSYVNPLFLGAAIVNKLIGVYGGGSAYNLRDSGEHIYVNGNGIIIMRGDEQQRRKVMSLADALVLDPKVTKAVAAIGARLQKLRAKSTRLLASLDRILALQRLPGKCDLI